MKENNYNIDYFKQTSLLSLVTLFEIPLATLLGRCADRDTIRVSQSAFNVPILTEKLGIRPVFLRLVEQQEGELIASFNLTQTIETVYIGIRPLF